MNGIENLAAQGRFGDNRLLHVSEGELQGLNALARDMYGQDLTTNPKTGLPEAFLFAPLLAPALMGAAGGALGTGALATGLVAGGLGAAEAKLRGMDDPLGQGLVAGLTAGAASGLGSSLAEVGKAGAGAGAGATGGVGSAVGTSVAPPPGVAPSPMPSPVGASVMPPTPSAPMPGVGSSPYPAPIGASPMGGATPTIPVENLMTGPGGGPTAASIQNPVTAQPRLTSPSNAPFGTQSSNYSDMLRGAKTLMSDKSGEALGQFAKQNRMPLAAGAAALGGKAALSAREDIRAAKEGKEAEYQRGRSDIREAYRRAGRQVPAYLMAGGGIVDLMGGGRPFDSAPRYLETGGMLGDGMSDDIPAMIDGNQPAALSDGEFVVPADVVSHLGNGSSDAGAQQLYSMMDRIRQARTGNKEQGKEINAKKYMPA